MKVMKEVEQMRRGERQPIIHYFVVSVPPRIHHVSSQGVMEVKRGASVTLECRASGNPVPIITWTRKVSHQYFNLIVIRSFLLFFYVFKFPF